MKKKTFPNEAMSCVHINQFQHLETPSVQHAIEAGKKMRRKKIVTKTAVNDKKSATIKCIR